MGTRSTIALEFADGTVEQVYCHWDGYLDHNGAILKEHYSNPFKLRELIDLGDLSSLRPEIGTKHAFSQFDLPAAEREAFEKLVWWLVTIETIQSTADPEKSSAEVIEKVIACYDIASQLLSAEEASGYQIEKLIAVRVNLVGSFLLEPRGQCDDDPLTVAAV